MHQIRPGSRRSSPKPMKPTPIIVADVLLPSATVIITGNEPTAIKPMPIPMTINGPQ